MQIFLDLIFAYGVQEANCACFVVELMKSECYGLNKGHNYNTLSTVHQRI